MKGIVALVMSIGILFGNQITVSAGEFSFYRDGFAAPNGKNLGQRNYLTEEDHTTLLAQFQNTEKYTANLALEIQNGGACYAMSAISMLSVHGMLDARVLDERLIDNEYISPSWYGISLLSSPKEFGGLYELPDKVVSFINYYQLTQATDVIRQNDAYQMYTMTDAERLQYLVECVENNGLTAKPTVFGYMGYFHGNDTRSMHAVLAIGVEYDSYEWNGKTYDGCIKLYDSNIPQEDDMLNLYFNTSDWSWLIPAYQLSNENGQVHGISNDVNMINHAGLMSDTDYSYENGFLGVLVTNDLQSEYTVSKAEISGDSWVYSDKSSNGVKETAAFYSDCVASAEKNFLTNDTDSGYVLDLASAQELDSAMYYENCLMRVQASNAVQFMVDPSGYLTISGEDLDYHFDMVHNEGDYSGSWYQFSVSGNADNAALKKTENGYLLTADNIQRVTVKANNDIAEATLTFSTDANSVLLCEVNQTTLAAKIDMDGDGTYETELTADTMVSFGDLNTDGSVDASDAADILTVAAVMGSGVESDLTEAQLAAADINADDMIDVIDAALVLQYAAHIGAGTTIMLEEYLSQIQIQKV